jgi:hypothetical protein
MRRFPRQPERGFWRPPVPLDGQDGSIVLVGAKMAMFIGAVASADHREEQCVSSFLVGQRHRYGEGLREATEP